VTFDAYGADPGSPGVVVPPSLCIPDDDVVAAPVAAFARASEGFARRGLGLSNAGEGARRAGARGTGSPASVVVGRPTGGFATLTTARGGGRRLKSPYGSPYFLLSQNGGRYGASRAIAGTCGCFTRARTWAGGAGARDEAGGVSDARGGGDDERRDSCRSGRAPTRPERDERATHPSARGGLPRGVRLVRRLLVLIAVIGAENRVHRARETLRGGRARREVPVSDAPTGHRSFRFSRGKDRTAEQLR
jgi:hypothetical protein